MGKIDQGTVGAGDDFLKKIESQTSVDTVRRESDKKETRITEAKLPGKSLSSRQALILKRLGEIQEQIDEYGLDRYKTELDEMYGHAETYFLQKKIKRMLSLPLDGLDMESKRIFINEHWEDICHEIGTSKVIDSKTGKQIALDQISSLNPLNLEDISDLDIERYFNFYRKAAPHNYTTYENSRYEFFYDDKYIVDAYKMPETDYTSMYPSYYSRMGKGYCALYDSGKGNVMKFFKLDDDTEQRVANRKQAEGSIQTIDLEDIIVEVEDALHDGDASYLTKYIYFRKSLPQSLRDELDNRLNLYVPAILNREFFHEDEFKILFEKSKQEIKISREIESLEFLSVSLKNLLAKKYESNEKENQGFKVENLNLLRNIAKSYGHVLDNAYYWFEDYLRERRFFPNDLVAEFEKRFPINFKHYTTNEFPYYDKSFLKEIEKTKTPIRKHFQWLSKELLARIEKINESRPELKEVSFDEILENEGFDRERMGTKEYNTLIENYTALMELETRRNLENEFGIKLVDFSVREQVQFVNFLSTKSEEEVKQVIRFLNQGAERTNRIKAFLSLEFNEKMGEVILGIGQSLESQPQVADELFAEYARMVDGVETVADEVGALYKDIFYEREIDREKLVRTMLQKAGDLFVEADKKIERASEKDKAQIITKLIEQLLSKEQAWQKGLDVFQQYAIRLNQLHKDFMKEFVLHDTRLIFNANRVDDQSLSKETLKKVFHGLDRFDSFVLRRIVEAAEATIVNINNYIKEDGLDKIHQAGDVYGEPDPMDVSRLINYEKIIISQKDKISKASKLLEMQKLFEKKLEQLIYGHEAAGLPEGYQDKIVAEIDQYQPELAQTEKVAYLPVGISSRPAVEGEVHRKPIDAFLWLFWLQNQGRQSRFIVADTIQRYNYAILPVDQQPADLKAAAIENGSRDRKWYGAVKNVFGLNNIAMPDDSAVSEYEQQIEKNPEVQEKLKLLQELEQQSPILARAMRNLVEPSIRERMLQTASSDEEKQQILKSIDMYGKEEMAFILFFNGQKLGHKKEWRYDMLARIIPIYQELRNRQDEIPELSADLEHIRNRDQALVELSLQLAYLKDLPEGYFFNARVWQVDHQSKQLKKQQEAENDPGLKKAIQKQLRELSLEAKQLKGLVQEAMKKVKDDTSKQIEDTAKLLGLVESPRACAIKWKETGEKLASQPWFQALDLPEFFYPKSINSLSFDITEKGEYMNFREAYSTYKGKSGEAMPIEANQIIASTEPLAAAKVLVLSEKNQRVYFDQVLRPLLVNFYLATSRSKQEAQQRFQKDFEQISTISEVIELIQRKIVWPVELEMKSGNGE